MASWFEVAGYSFQEFSAGGVRTFAIVEGRSTGFPVVLLHNTPGASFMWSTTIRALGRGRRVIAPDYPGWGRSRERGSVPRVTLTRNGLRSWLNSVLAAQQIEQFDLVGLGDGALLALDFLIRHEPRVRRLCLLNLPLKTGIKRRARWPWSAGGWQGNKLQDWLVKESGLSGELLQQVGPMFDELLAGGWHADCSPEFPTDEFVGELATYQEGLRRFSGEAFLAWSGQAAGYDAAHAARFSGNRTPVVWAESVNFPMWEQPQLYETELIDFLGK